MTKLRFLLLFFLALTVLSAEFPDSAVAQDNTSNDFVLVVPSTTSLARPRIQLRNTSSLQSWKKPAARGSRDSAPLWQRASCNGRTLLTLFSIQRK